MHIYVHMCVHVYKWWCVWRALGFSARPTRAFSFSLARYQLVRVRANTEHIQSVQGLLPWSQGQNLALTVVCVAYWLDGAFISQSVLIN